MFYWFFNKNDVFNHVKTNRLFDSIKQKINILNISHFSNLSNLHFIENVFNYTKNSLKKHDLKFFETNEKSKTYIKNMILKKWKQN